MMRWYQVRASVRRERMRFFTIGHSNQTMDELIELLRKHGIKALVDVRSQPYSRYSSQFNRELLKEDVESAGFVYVFLGDVLGGRPEGREFYLPDGSVNYEKLRASEAFLKGIERLEQGAEEHAIAIVCSEADPGKCHRHYAIGEALFQRGHEILHIMSTGELVDEATLQERDRATKAEQMTMFAGEENAEWNSTP